MTAEWPIARLGELIDINHGFAFKGVNFTEVPGPWVLLTPGNFATGGGFKLGKLKYYEGEVPSEYVLSPGELIVTMTDLSKNMDTLGFPAWVPDFGTEQSALHNQRLGRVLRKSVDTDLAYLYYLMRGKEYRHEVQTSASGSTVHHTSPSRILAFEFPLPPLEEQRGIAATLGALDDKIDSNRRAHETLWGLLEAQHRSLQSQGSLAVLGDVVALRYGKALPAKHRRVGEVPVYGSNGVTGQHDEALIEGPAVLVGRKGSVGEVHWSHESCFPIDTTFHVEPMSGYPLISAYFLLRGAGLTGKNTDSAIPGLNRDNALSTEIVLPIQQEANQWASGVIPLVARAQQLLAENQQLADLRDALLPELLSGRIRVPEAALAVAATSS